VMAPFGIVYGLLGVLKPTAFSGWRFTASGPECYHTHMRITFDTRQNFAYYRRVVMH
jgi:hypothetical protein